MNLDIKNLFVAIYKRISSNGKLLVVLGVGMLLIASSKKGELENIEKNLSNIYEQTLNKIKLQDKMKTHKVPGVSIAFIKNGRLDWARGYGVLQVGKDDNINTETMFSVGSVSKVGAAVLLLKMAEQKLVNIDEDVNQYLKSWKVKRNQYTIKKPVTLRATMSHTAGLTVHGFADFMPNENLPTTVQILKGERPAKNNEVYVNIPVGSRFRYAGGGTTVQQLLIEDISNKKFHEAASKLLFKPLKMNRSSYENPLPGSFGNIAKAHNRNGRTVALPRGYQAMPESAASGLWTTPTDFSKLMIMLMNSYDGTDNDYLSRKVVEDMMTPVAPSKYGLGPRISSKGNAILFSHGGSNDSYRAHFVGNLKNKNGLIIFTNGTNGRAIIREVSLALESFVNKG